MAALSIPILDDNKNPTSDLLRGRPLLRVKVWINGDLVVPNGYGLVDTGSRLSSIHRSMIGNNMPDIELPNVNTSGENTAEGFSLASIQVENFREIPVNLSIFGGPYYFDILIGRDILRFCNLVMTYAIGIFTIDMP
jgi:hypothetical protein